MKGIRTRLKQVLKDESGQAVVLAAAGMVAILGFAGLALDIGQMRYERRQLQAAADAAAMAAVLELTKCAGTADCSTMMTAAEQAMTENGMTVASANDLKQCASGSTTELTLTINNGPCALGSTASDPNYGNTGYVEAVVSTPQNTFFARVLGINSKTISARAEAALGNSQFCVYTSTSSTDQGSSGPVGILMNSTSSITAGCGIEDDSGSSDALETNSGSSIRSTIFKVTGQWGLVNGGTASPTPTTSATAVSDPLAYLQSDEPTTGGCTQTNLVVAGTTSLSAGTYCGGINFNSGSGAYTVTFGAGTYVFTGDVNVDTAVTLNGTGGVTLYFASGSLTMNSASTVDLVAPTSGSYAGILIWQASTDSSAMIIDSNSSSTLQGAIYLPDAQLTLNSAGNLAAYSIVDVNNLIVDSGASFTLNNNYSSLSGGSPIKSGAMLAE